MLHVIHVPMQYHASCRHLRLFNIYSFHFLSLVTENRHFLFSLKICDLYVHTVYLVIVDCYPSVQQPMSGRSFTLFCLKKTHAKVKPLDVVLLYAHNDIPFLREVRK